MAPEQPHTYPRRILLAVSGLTPQIITETLYALIAQPTPFVPTEVRLITTREGAARARLALLSDDPGWFRRLCRDFRVSAITFDENHIETFSDGEGRPLDDIRTPADNTHAADRITEIVRSLTSDPQAALHVSIAGGRKTMGYYLGYALSLFGRPQDRLSHVLVSEPFESSWEFFYPTPYERIIQTRDGKLADCREAKVTLAEIPFVRLREGLPPRLLDGQASMSEVVAAAERAQHPPRLVLDLATRAAWADEIALNLSATEFALLLWLARRAQAGEPMVDWTTPAACDEFLRVAKEVFNPMSGDYERIEEALDWRRDAAIRLGEYFQPHKSRINRAFEAALGKTAARRYQIPPRGPNALPLEAERIDIR
ncbi:CRISPR-associated ring nuclease Csm6 [Sulfuricystis multivorans]|uniref:CRISPR-associated ring nuclease Csm6 n=1 Tax=Sulfuricystis multivorans TaxID=2211108 RepID=UPI000F831F1B|nr:CRISPR-associated ring nuclease Csm6 [Sulfuricystis multivorans]